MSHYRLQKDDFAPDAEAVREAVVAGKFSTEIGPDGAEYTGISMHPVPHWFGLISELVGKKIEPKLSCFRLNLAGELPHSWVHSDGICADWASVLYLNPPEQCQGGTAFWRHRHLGITELPKREGLAEMGVDSYGFYKHIEEDWKKQDLWEQIDFVPMKWNRFITYPTSLFHSRFPFEASGSGPKDGRLIWICFYDTVNQV